MLGKRHSIFLSALCSLLSVVLLLLCCADLSAQEVPAQYRKYLLENRDTRSLPEKILNKVGLTRADVGRSFALLCGISTYPNIQGKHGNLKPAAEDIQKLQAYLKQHEFFDEVVVLRDKQVTLRNLEYFLQTYFPKRLKQFPKSRFLFAYSGHGMTENNKGYLLKSTARSLDDKGHAIRVKVLKVYIDEVVAAAHQVLVLLNSCHSGVFLKRPYGKLSLLPKYPGAHAITASGPSELAWHIEEVGSGSIFYEKLLAGISGIADAEKDGIVTSHELYSYLRREIQLVSNQDQTPQMGDISLHGSRGEFFFLKRETPLVQQEGVKVSGGTAMGGSVQETWTEPTTGMEFVRIEGGCFQMGSPPEEEGRRDNEGPVHEACVDSFWMGKYEVTNRQFRLFRAEYYSGDYEEEHSYGEYKGESFNGDKQPVVDVSWKDAHDYAAWLAQQSGKKIRLPTEAEWEYAARAGTNTASFWGDSPDNVCRYANVYDQMSNKKYKSVLNLTPYNCNDGYAVTAPVGSFQANSFGLYDMLGNVYEWCADWYEDKYYATSQKYNPLGPSLGSLRVVRGGGWIYNSFGDTRSALRYGGTPNNRDLFLGFRLALPVQQGK